MFRRARNLAMFFAVQVGYKLSAKIYLKISVIFSFFAEPCAVKSAKSQISQKSFGFLTLGCQ